jgi:hypothetical protein
MVIKGASAGILPSQPNSIVFVIKKKVTSLYTGLNLGFSIKDLPKKGKKLKIIIAKLILTTPPNLSGQDLSIA